MKTYDEIGYSLGHIESKVDGIISRLDRMNGAIIRHEDKLNILEIFRDNLQGKMSIIGAICGLMGGAITLMFKYFIGK